MNNRQIFIISFFGVVLAFAAFIYMVSAIAHTTQHDSDNTRGAVVACVQAGKTWVVDTGGNGSCR